MRVIGSKIKKEKIVDRQSEQTTDINSKQHSRRNSLFLKLSKNTEIQVVPLTSIRVDPLAPSARHKRKFMNVTVSKDTILKIKNTIQGGENTTLNVQTAKTARQVRKSNFLKFNFCQQIPNDQNFYAKTFLSDNDQTEKQNTGLCSENKEALIENTKRQNSTLTSKSSPILKLEELEGSFQVDDTDGENFKSGNIAAELQSLLDRL